MKQLLDLKFLETRLEQALRGMRGSYNGLVMLQPYMVQRIINEMQHARNIIEWYADETAECMPAKNFLRKWGLR